MRARRACDRLAGSGHSSKISSALDEPRFHRLFPIHCPRLQVSTSSSFMDTRRRSSSCCENGRTTTPFDMLVKNRCSRIIWSSRPRRKWRCAIQPTAALAEALIMRYEGRLVEYRRFTHGMDPPDITEWKWPTLKFSGTKSPARLRIRSNTPSLG